MKVVVIGGTGLLGSKVVNRLRRHGHHTVPASLDTGVNTLTGAGLAEAMQGAAVVVDVSDSPTVEGAAALEFFETSTRNILDAEAAAGVGHHVAVSIVGTDRVAEGGYFRAKVAQEKLITTSSIPFSIVRATQFFEFFWSIADAATEGDTVRLARVLIQPIAADDAARAVCRVAVNAPRNGIIEVAGPLWFRLDDVVRRVLSARNDPRQVVADSRARFFGTELYERSLLPDDDAEVGATRFDDWLAQRHRAAQPH